MINFLKRHFEDKLHNKIINDLAWNVDYGLGIRIEGTEIVNEFSFQNQKCHLNAYDTYKRNPNMRVKVCYTAQNGTDYGFVHFINYDVESGRYIDNTLGSDSPKYDYYILEDSWLDRVSNLEDAKPNQWLGWVKHDFYLRYCTSWVWRLFIKEDEL